MALAQTRTLRLHGGKIRYTMLPDSHFEVISGRVLVYILPIRAGHADRRFLLYEAAPGDKIPALCCDAPYSYNSAEICTWCFGLVAVDEAELIQQPCALPLEAKQALTHSLGMHGADFEDFENCCIEEYQLRLTKELRSLYTTEREHEAVKERNLDVIFDLFRSKKQRRGERGRTGSLLYDAIARICDARGIALAPLETITAACGRRFISNDAARISHFVCRDIILAEGWQKRDCGPVLAWRAKDKRPMACLPDGPGAYICYDPAEGTSQRLTAQLAAGLDPRAQMFYRPFPSKALTLRDIVAFGLHDVSPRDIAAFLLLSLAGTGIGLLLPYINEKLYDSFIPSGNANGLLEACLVVLACTIGSAMFTAVKNLATFRSMSSMDQSIQSAAYDRVFNMPESFFRDYECADLAQRVMSLSSIFKMAVQVLLTTVLTAVCSFMYLGRMFAYSAGLARLSLAMLLAAMAIIGLLGWRQTAYNGQLIKLEATMSSRLYQIINGIDKIRMAGAEENALCQYLKPYTDARRIALANERLGHLTTVISTAMSGVFSLVLYYAIATGGTGLTMGEFMGFISAFGAFSGAMLEAVSSVLSICEIVPLYGCVRPILEQTPETEDDTGLPGELTGEIEISNVTFAYDKDSPAVLKDISLHIHPGEYVGIVGPSGCGKSTLLKLLLGFEKPQSGKIFYDGRDIDSMDKRELRKKFGVVLQDGKLISGSIYENITIAAPNADIEQVQQAVRDVGLEQDIAQMPMGLYTMLSEGSGTISGGQCQRILIARAIVGSPRILYFDEATSALDNVTQAQVTESLGRLRATRLVIAHRLSTIMQCDRIIVINNGSICESGTYEQLMAKRGLFYSLAARQMS